MKLISVKCPICDVWRARIRHCPVCGCNHVTEDGKRFYYVNNQGVLMARSIPRRFEDTIKMNYRETPAK